MRKQGSRFYYGWLVLAAISGVNFANGATAIGVLTVFIIPFSEEFGWSRTQIAGATSTGALLGAAAAPLTGRLTDRLGARLPLAMGASLVVLANLNLAAMQGLIWFYVAFSVARMADQGLIQAPSPPAVARWFARSRGRAMAMLFLATSAGGVLLPLMAQLVITAWGWRAAWLALGAIMLVVGLVPTLLWVRRQPEDMGLTIDGDAISPREMRPTMWAGHDRDRAGMEDQWRFAEAVRTPVFWLMAVAVLLIGVVSTGVSLHLVPHLVQRGIASTAAVGAVSASFLASAVSTVAWGYLADRVSARWLLLASFALRTAAIGILLTVGSLTQAYAFAVLHGITEAGIRTTLVMALAGYFGRQELGSIYGLARALQVAGFAIGPVLAGWAYDASESYGAAFAAFLVLGTIGSLLVTAAGRPARLQLRPITGG